MASARALVRIERLVWVLVYGGLFAFVLGIAVGRSDSGSTSAVLMVAGVVVALAGVALIVVRARLKLDA